jgi:hypothetical protein
MSKEFGKVPADLAVKNIHVDRSITGCTESEMRFKRVDACEINVLVVNGDEGLFNNLEVNNITINNPFIADNPLVIGSSNRDEITTPIPLGAVLIDPAALFTFYEVSGNITDVGGGSATWTFNVTGVYEVALTYRVFVTDIPANTPIAVGLVSEGINMITDAGGGAPAAIPVTTLTTETLTATGAALTRTQAYVIGRTYIRVTAPGQFITLAATRAGSVGTHNMHDKSLRIEWLRP